MPELAPEPPQWPKVVGIISIVWASLGLFCAPCGMIMPFLYPMIMPPELMEGGLPPNMQVNPLMMGAQGVGLLMAVLLLAAGIATVKRTPNGRTLHLAYAALQVPGLIFGLWLVYKMHIDLTDWIANNPGNKLAQQQASGGDTGLFVGIALTVIFGGVYPTFLAIWFGLVKRTPQSMLESTP